MPRDKVQLTAQPVCVTPLHPYLRPVHGRFLPRIYPKPVAVIHIHLPQARRLPGITQSAAFIPSCVPHSSPLWLFSGMMRVALPVIIPRPPSGKIFVQRRLYCRPVIFRAQTVDPDCAPAVPCAQRSIFPIRSPAPDISQPVQSPCKIPFCAGFSLCFMDGCPHLVVPGRFTTLLRFIQLTGRFSQRLFDHGQLVRTAYVIRSCSQIIVLAVPPYPICRTEKQSV